MRQRCAAPSLLIDVYTGRSHVPFLCSLLLVDGAATVCKGVMTMVLMMQPCQQCASSVPAVLVQHDASCAQLEILGEYVALQLRRNALGTSSILKL